MIEFYQLNSLKEYFKDVDTTLCTPYKQPEQSNPPNNTPHATPNATRGNIPVTSNYYGLRVVSIFWSISAIYRIKSMSPIKCSNILWSSSVLQRWPFSLTGGGKKSFGVVRARYDFSARDRSELSLREGDTIKILTKKGQSGWWKGEVYGRVRTMQTQKITRKKYPHNLNNVKAFCFCYLYCLYYVGTHKKITKYNF